MGGWDAGAERSANAWIVGFVPSWPTVGPNNGGSWLVQELHQAPPGDDCPLLTVLAHISRAQL